MGDVAFAAIYNTTVTSGFAQIGAHAALTGQDDGASDAVLGWQARRDLIVGELEGLPVVSPDGGWSLLVDAEALGTGALEFSTRLLERSRIAATPMTAWGQEVAPRYVRLVYAKRTARTAPWHRHAFARGAMSAATGSAGDPTRAPARRASPEAGVVPCRRPPDCCRNAGNWR